MTLWTIWLEQIDRVLNYEQWHESKMKHLIWDDLTMYAKVAWARVAKFVEINTYLAKALSKSSMKLGGARNVLSRQDRMKIM